ncbi:MAG: hypothetical protein V4648_04370 [Bacteroidota bacterium]
MDTNQNEILISQYKRPAWHFILGGLFYIAAIGLTIYAFYQLYTFPEDYSYEKDLGGNLTIALFALVAGLGSSIVRTRYLNLEKEKLQTEFRLWFLKIRIQSSMPELEYVSVFKNESTETYEVNLWYEGNHHFNVDNFDEAEPAFEYAKEFSEKLNLKVLDASVKGNSKWI